MGIPSFPGDLLFEKLSNSKAHSSAVIFPSHDTFCSSESLGSLDLLNKIQSFVNYLHSCFCSCIVLDKSVVVRIRY